VTEHATDAILPGRQGGRSAVLSGDDADVIVVGAGPSGSTAAYYLAQAGLNVLLIEKSRFPREKVCGDGLTPRAVKSLVAMGIDVSEEAGWLRNKGLRVIGGGLRLELPWPELSSYPGYGLVRTRASLDEMLARRAQSAGAKLLEGTTVTGPLLDDDGQVAGVVVQAEVEGSGGEGGQWGQSTADHEERKVAAPSSLRARVVVAADGNSSRLSVALGLRKRDDRPLGVAVRTYYKSPRHDDDYLE